MNTKEIIHKLEQLFNKSAQKKKRKKQLVSLNKLIGLLEEKEKKFALKLTKMESDIDKSNYQRKLELTQLHLAKAIAFKQELEA